MRRAAALSTTGDALEIRLLGELEIVRGGHLLALPASKKTRALLGYLVASGKPHLREQLCSLLWDGPDDPRAALRWSLTKLRPLLDGPAEARLIADRERVSFDPQGADVDLVAVTKLARGGFEHAPTPALIEAAARFRGPFLEALDLPGSHRFHAWCVGFREQLQAHHVALLGALVRRCENQPEAALPYARALVALDPLAESSHVHLVRLLGELGRVREAQEAYEHCRGLLQRELGTRPSRELEQARMALGRPTAPAAPAPTAAAAPAPALAVLPRLLGREPERAVLAQLITSVQAGSNRQALLLLGDPGIGKSRLLDQLGAEVRAAGGSVLAGRAFEAEMVRPYGVWLEALRSDPTAPDIGAASGGLAALFPGITAALGDSGDRNHLFEAVQAHLAERARKAGLLLVILDDVHWLDETSAALLHFAARALAGSPVLLACAARSGELSDNGPALRTIRALDRDGRLLQLPLGPLARDAITAMVEALGHDVDGAAVFSESEGNPLCAIEIARALARAETRALPATLQLLIAERLERLEERTRHALTYAAALGRNFDPDTLGRVTGLPAADLVAALTDLERHAVIRASGPGGYDFSHDLIRRGAYQQMPEPRRRLVHLQIARALTLLPAAREVLASDIAHHGALGGDAEVAARHCALAGQRCLRMFAWAEATELAMRGLHQCESLPPALALPLRRELLGIRVVARPDRQQLQKVDDELVGLIRELEAAGLQGEVALALRHRSWLQFWAQDTAGAADTLLRATTAGQAAGAAARARAMADEGRCLVLLDRDIPRAKSLLAEAQQVLAAETDRDSQIQVVLDWGLGALQHYLGQSQAAQISLERALATARAEQARYAEYDCWRVLAMLALEQGQVERAQRVQPSLHESAVRLHGDSERPTAAALCAIANGLAGADGAAADLDRAVAELRAVDSKAMLAYALTFAADQALAKGRHEIARAHAEEALAAAMAVGRRSTVACAHALLARSAAAAGDLDDAAAHLAAVAADRDTPLGISAFSQGMVDRARAEVHQAAATPPAR